MSVTICRAITVTLIFHIFSRRTTSLSCHDETTAALRRSGPPRWHNRIASYKQMIRVTQGNYNYLGVTLYCHQLKCPVNNTTVRYDYESRLIHWNFEFISSRYVRPMDIRKCWPLMFNVRSITRSIPRVSLIGRSVVGEIRWMHSRQSRRNHDNHPAVRFELFRYLVDGSENIYFIFICCYSTQAVCGISCCRGHWTYRYIQGGFINV